jgi:hypothetical protein
VTGIVARISLPRSLRWGVALALFAVAVATVAHAVPNGGDFRLSIWYPGQAMWHGHDPYDIASFERFYGSHQVEAFSKGWFPLYGPIHLWLALFFALFPVKVAAVLFFMVNVGGLLVMATVVTRALDRRLGAPAVLAVTGLLMLTRPGRATVESGQATVIYSLLVYLVWSQARRRPWLAALALAGALGKPPFGLPLLAIVLFRRLWPLARRAVGIFVGASLPIVLWLTVNAGSLVAVGRAVAHNLSYTDHNPLDAPGSPGRIDALSLIARYSHGHFGGAAEVAAFVVIMGLVAVLVARVSSGPGWPLSPAVVLALGLATVLCVAHEYYDLLLLAWPLATVLRRPVVFVLDQSQSADGSGFMTVLRARLGGPGQAPGPVDGAVGGDAGRRWSGWLTFSAVPALVVTVLPAHETLKVLGLGTGTSIISTVTTASLLLALAGAVAVLAFGDAPERPAFQAAAPGRRFPSLADTIAVEPAVVEPVVIEPVAADTITLDVNPADSG